MRRQYSLAPGLINLRIEGKWEPMTRNSDGRFTGIQFNDNLPPYMPIQWNLEDEIVRVPHVPHQSYTHGQDHYPVRFLHDRDSNTAEPVVTIEFEDDHQIVSRDLAYSAVQAVVLQLVGWLKDNEPPMDGGGPDAVSPETAAQGDQAS